MPQAVTSGEPSDSNFIPTTSSFEFEMPKGDNPRSTPIWGAATEKPIPGSSSSCPEGCSCSYCFGLDRNVVAMSFEPSSAASSPKPKPKPSAVIIDLTLDDDEETNQPTAERAMASVTSNSPLPPSVEAAYYRKCIELKRRINEIEASNDELRLRKARTERGILKLRLERAFLLEQLEKRMKNNVDDSDDSDSPPPTVSTKATGAKKRARSNVSSPEPSPPEKKPRTSEYVSPSVQLTSYQPVDKPLRSKRGHRKATPPPVSSAPTSQQPTPAHQNITQPNTGVFAPTTAPVDLAALTTGPPSTTPSFLQTVGATQPFQPTLNGATTLPPLSQIQQPYDPVAEHALSQGGVEGAATAMTNGPAVAGEASSRVEDEAAAAASLAGLSRGDVNGPAAGGDTEMRDAGAGEGFGFTAVNR